MDRRDFLKKAGRLSILGIVVLIFGKFLFFRKKKPIEDCINYSICKDCRVLSECKLPKAISLKSFRKD